MDLHRIGEQRSRAYHGALVARLDAAMLDRVRERVASWRARGTLHPRLADRWEQLLDLPPEQLSTLLVAEDEEMRRLRSVSPFAGELTARERWALWRGPDT